MFWEAFGLRRDPFMDTADPAFYYETIACANGRRRLAECLVDGRGLAVVVGPIGAGKTTLCNAAADDVMARPDVRVGSILDPTFGDEAEFLREAGAALGIDIPSDAGAREAKDAIKRALLASVGDRVQFVLFIDEAHLLTEPLFETLRGLLNFQIDQRKLLAIALAGQMELVPLLGRHPALSDRVAEWIELVPLGEAEAGALLDHRVKRAGYLLAHSPFEPETVAALWGQSAGLPRRLTALARAAMQNAADRGARVVAPEDVEAALRRVAPLPVAAAIAAAPSPPVAASAATRSPARGWPWRWFVP
jgi:type II secretory pathway predicted ATPase ExeA